MKELKKFYDGLSDSSKRTLALHAEDYFEPEGNVALAFQNPEALFFNSTVFEEISYSLTVAGNDKENIKTLTEIWMNKWGLNPEIYADKYPYKLSGGEKRRVALAACTILKPKIILFGIFSMSPLFKPIPVVALHCGSKSINKILFPSSASEAARLILVVVFPTPPF